jgi:CYTH domain-containing protein
MPNEIERQFLPPGDDWKKLVTHSFRICDELITACHSQKVRVGIAGQKKEGRSALCARIRVRNPSRR